MEWLTNILRNLKGCSLMRTEYAYANPKVGYLVVIFLLLVWLVGLIFDWKWTYARPGSWEEISFLTYWVQPDSDFGSV